MLKQHRNELFTLILRSDLDESLFDAETKDYLSEFKIFAKEYKERFYFKIRANSSQFAKSKYDIKYTIIDSAAGLIPKEIEINSFTEVKSKFETWLRTDVLNFLKDSEQPDFWNFHRENINQINEIKKIDYSSNKNFTIEQKEQFKLALGEAKILITQQVKLDNHQLDLLNKRVNYLIEAIDRNNLTDWKNIFISTIIGLILNLGVDTETGRMILNFFRRAFNGLFLIE